MSKQKETWKNGAFVGFSNYNVSSEGRIKNLKTGRYLEGWMEKNGRRRVRVTSDDNVDHETESIKMSKAKFILLVWKGLPKYSTWTTHHIDKNKLNDIPSNLKWLSPSLQNIKKNKNKYPQWKPIVQLKKIDGKEEFIKKWDYCEEICEEYSVSLEKIKNIINLGQKFKDHIFIYAIVYLEPLIPKIYWKKFLLKGYKPIEVCTYLGMIMTYNGTCTFGTKHQDEYCYAKLSPAGPDDEQPDKPQIAVRDFKTGKYPKKDPGKAPIHRIIASARWGPNSDLVVDHKNEMTDQNHYKNLHYVTIAENNRLKLERTLKRTG